MASAIYYYDHAWRLISGPINLDAAEIRIALVTSAYAPSAAHTAWAQASANEVAAGNGYTTGGLALGGQVITNSKRTYANPVWPGLTKTFRYGVGRYVGTALAITDPLLFWILFNTTPADEIQNNSNFEIKINPTDGLFYRPA